MISLCQVIIFFAYNSVQFDKCFQCSALIIIDWLDFKRGLHLYYLIIFLKENLTFKEKN